jgi:hypothetical protein
MTAPVFRRDGAAPIANATADFAEALSRLEPVSAQNVVEFSFTSAELNKSVPHGLKTAYRGAIVIAQTGTNRVFVLHPSVHGDAARTVRVVQDTAIAQTVRILVL